MLSVVLSENLIARTLFTRVGPKELATKSSPTLLFYVFAQFGLAHFV